ncbi:MAG TPA: ElyC/SanA/YdcF family protein [Anaerolineaceae bacterium]|nr:ElyC/SanA/YdcF family protein [Anaerolineaceae bacterium]HQL91783.1 ElyC/SanA/YdcF family protein [Anaerolineaceae bacterium]
MRYLKTFLIVFLIVFFLLGGFRVAMLLISEPLIKSYEDIQAMPVVMVPGAGLLRDGTPSSPLRDRLDAAAQLYRDGKVQKILLTGDNRFVNYNEPGAMRNYLIQTGIPEEDLVLDYAGRRTYDSCYRAKAIFGLDEIIIVTQPYHLPRAVFLCDKLGLETQGLPIEQSQYIRSRFLFWNFREIFATLAAYWDIYISKPLPVLGEPEPIFN